MRSTPSGQTLDIKLYTINPKGRLWSTQISSECRTDSKMGTNEHMPRTVVSSVADRWVACQRGRPGERCPALRERDAAK